MNIGTRYSLISDVLNIIGQQVDGRFPELPELLRVHFTPQALSSNS